MKKLCARLIVILITLICISCFSYAENMEPVPFDQVDIQERCYVLLGLINTPQFERDKGKPFLEDKLVINDQVAYREFQVTASKARNMACKEAHFPSIDFSQKTLLGNWVSGSCAATGFEKEVSKDTKKKEITYRVKVKARNISCSGPGLHSMNLITVPKISKDYKVIFEPAPSDHREFRIYRFENGKEVARDWWGKIVSR